MDRSDLLWDLGIWLSAQQNPLEILNSKLDDVISDLHVSLSEQRLRLTPTFGSSQLQTIYDSTPLECQVYGLQDLVPRVLTYQRLGSTLGFGTSGVPHTYISTPSNHQIVGILDNLLSMDTCPR